MAPVTTRRNVDREHARGRAEAEAVGRKARRLGLLRRAGLFGADTQGTRIARACTLQDLRQAYRLVYYMYRRAGYIRSHPCKLRIRTFEACPETATFVAEKRGRIFATLGLVLDSSDLGLPSDGPFRGELDALRSRGMRLCEGTNQAVIPSFRRTAVPTELMRCGVAQAYAEGRNAIIVTVSPAHSSFYELLGFRRMTQVRNYSSALDDPVVMMCLNMRDLEQTDARSDPSESFARDFLSLKNPYLQRVKTWQGAASRYFLDVNLLRRLFVIESDLLDTCTEAQYQAIRRRWGDRLFSEVVGSAADAPRVTVPEQASLRRAPADGDKRATPTTRVAPSIEGALEAYST